MYSQVHPCFYMYVRIYICIHISGKVGASVVHAKTRLGCTREKATHLFTRILMLMMVLTVMMMMMMVMMMMLMIPGRF